MSFRTLTMLAALAAVGTVGAPAAVAGASPRATAHDSARRMAAPRQLSPDDGRRVQAVPSFAWKRARRAVKYEFQLSADPAFKSIVLGQGKGSFQTPNTFATVEGALADGTYYWRVRGINARKKVGRWSPVRSIEKRWETAPRLLGPADGETVSYPGTPLVLRWDAVPYAYKYVVQIATDPELAHSAINDRSRGIETSGTALALPTALAAGRYYWAVTPLDNDKHPGARSAVSAFEWAWPTATATSLSDLSDAWPIFDAASPYFVPNSQRIFDPVVPHVFDPQLKWLPVPGAARYEVEINHSEDFAAGSKVCCREIVLGTSLLPRNVLANNRYYWRVRALDADDNAGTWNYGPVFQKDFDLLQDRTSRAKLPSVRNLRLVRHPSDGGSGTVDGVPVTRIPMVAWDPVVGASSYEVQVVPRISVGCNWTSPSRWDVVTAATAWTPLSPVWNRRRPGGVSYERVAKDPLTSVFGDGATYCVRVLAQSDRDDQRDAVVSDWTQLNGAGGAAFAYEAAPAAPARDPFAAVAGDYLTPVTGAVNSRLPLFTWKPIPGAGSYFVVVAKDASFTEIRDLAITNVPAYAPRNGVRPWTYPDETTSYYWAVVPALTANGNGAPYPPLENSPRSFVKRSNPPVRRTPGPDAAMLQQPTFTWSPAEGARTYTFQVSADDAFGELIEDVITDSTGYTSLLTHPADSVLYWRVRANDENRVGLRWSDTGRFSRRLAVPALSPGNPTEGEGIPILSWSPVEGASSYDMHVEQADGSKRDFSNLRSTAFTPVVFYGTGVWHWRVRANFKSGSRTVSGGYSGYLPFTRRIATPTGVDTSKAGNAALLSWDPAGMAREYRIQISTSDSFSSIVEQAKTDNTSFAPKMVNPVFESGEPLYWRVAVVDEGSNTGGWATSPLRAGRVMKLRVRGSLRAGRSARVGLTVRDGRGRPVRGARVRVSGAGVLARPKRTNRRGKLTLRLSPMSKGKVRFRVDKRGYTPVEKSVRAK